ncbi:hypothetical protein C2S51_004488 [Perilla frutescens var. frutescens]|nr:hypothetical protein C2S51_004488 [Perilla frutescens var. frutescens]
MAHLNDAVYDISGEHENFSLYAIAYLFILVTTIEFDFAADFGSFEKVRGHFHAHPIYKSIKVAEGKKFCDIFTLVDVPRRRRSVWGGRVEKKRAVQDAGSIANASSRTRDVRNKPKAETSNSEVSYSRSFYNGRLSRRLCASTTKGQKLGKLGSAKFESYIESMWRKLPEGNKNEFTYLDSLWFSLYAKEPYKAKVLSWIKKKDIFSKKYVFVPIVQWDHWFLLIFCHFGEDSEAKSKRRCMLLLDSLQEANSKQLAPGIRRFVFDIFKTEERPESKQLIRKIPLLIPKVPQQKNGEECGFFVLYYINQFLDSAPDNFSFSTGCPHFMKEDWFTPADVECFVESLDSVPECFDCSD